MTNKQVETVISQRKQILEAAEEILRAEAENDSQLTADELAVLEAAGITSENHDRELARVKRVIRFQEAAGTRKDREAVRQQIAKAEQIRDEKLPKLRRELEETVERLEGQIAELVEGVELPAKKLEAMEQACDHLRDTRILPKHVTAEYNHCRGRTKSTFHDVPQAESLIATLPNAIALCNAAKTDRQVQEGRQFRTYASSRNLFTQNGESRQLVLNQEKLAKHVAELEHQFAEAQKVVQGREDFDAALADAESIRDFYIR